MTIYQAVESDRDESGVFMQSNNRADVEEFIENWNFNRPFQPLELVEVEE